MRNPLLACALAVLATPLLLAQSTGRTMQLLAPAVLGQTASFGVSYPASAAGNLYSFLWCMPPFVGTMPLTVPGFTVQGSLRVDPANSVSAFTGVFGAGGSVAHALAIPNHPSFVGMSWDLQSIDLAVGAGVLSLADNDLTVVLADGPLASLNMVPIAPGTFSMGSNATMFPPYYAEFWERPVHPVTISRPFWMGKYEVTHAEYQAVIASWPYSSNRPVSDVSWNDAMAYCAALTAREAAAGRLPTGYEYRLPTEAEWEYCCRAGTTTEYHYGPTLVCTEANFAYSHHTNSACNIHIGPARVGLYAPNAWGLCDMHGNVKEWCLDGWDGSANYSSAAVTDPYVSSGPDRVLRGGGWGDHSNYCRSAARFRVDPSVRELSIGFRVVLAPVPTPLVPAQGTGRTMQLLAPAVLGQTASFGVSYPVSAAGNLYSFLWCMPPFAGTMPLTVPGFTVQGSLLVDPANSVSSFTGVFGAGGSVSHALAIPNHPSFVGMAWDLQSIDLAVGAGVLSLADNELAVVLADGPLASLNMVPIAPGTYQRGSPVTPLNVAPYFNQAWSQPVHTVAITRPFWMGKYEVTQAEYQAVMGTNPSSFQGANLPVERVSWLDAMAYCAALTAREAAAGRLPAGYEYRLPTEAEWEYCCRAGTTTEFHYGPSLVCWQAMFSVSRHGSIPCNPSGTVPVGGYAPNAWGLHDMHGNVREWCLDGWDGSANYPFAAVIDPYVSTPIGFPRVFRGGSWLDSSSSCRSAFRDSGSLTFQFYGIGFRVALAPVLVP